MRLAAAEFVEAHSNRGTGLHDLKRHQEALASYDRALALQPDYAEAHANRGNTLHQLNRCDEALASYDRALVLRPDFAEAHCNRGNALQELRRFDEALTGYDRALVLRPDFAEAHSNRGNVLQELRRLTRRWRAMNVRWSCGRPRRRSLQRAMCRPLIGDFARGWQELEWRWETAQLRSVKRHFPQPLWTGADNIAGKTILLHAEQGFGDTLQFCRYVPARCRARRACHSRGAEAAAAS